MNEKEEKKLIEEYLKSKTRRADKDDHPTDVDDVAPLPDLPFDKPSTSGHGKEKKIKG